MLEKRAMQDAEVVGEAELRPICVVLGQHDAEVVITHIRREVVAHDAVDAPVQLLIDDVGLQDLEKGKSRVGLHTNIQLDGDDLQLNGVAITGGVVPMRQVVETVVDHLHRSAQVLLPTLSTCQIGKISRQSGTVRRDIVLIETDALEAISKICVHDYSRKGLTDVSDRQ